MGRKVAHSEKVSVKFRLENTNKRDKFGDPLKTGTR
jgi:hypothetical protein